MTDKILLKINHQSNPQEVRFTFLVFGPNAYIRLNQVEFAGNAAYLARELRRIADEIEPSSVQARQARLINDQLPQQLYSPRTAWPWLIKRFPWLFDGINLSNEPYSSYLRPDRATIGPDQALNDDVQAVSHLQNPTLADISEALTGSRQYGGSLYVRVKAVKDALEVSTTTRGSLYYPQNKQKKAA